MFKRKYWVTAERHDWLLFDQYRVETARIRPFPFRRLIDGPYSTIEEAVEKLKYIKENKA